MINWRVLPLGEAALLVEGQPSGDTTNRLVLALAAAVDRATLPGVAPPVPATNTLLIPFDPLRLAHRELAQTIEAMLARLAIGSSAPSRVVTILIRYGGEAGPDLDAVAQQIGLTSAEVVALHSAPLYRVQFLGFAPGFPYLGPLPPPLVLPRRATPRTAVPAGSVAIGAEYSGIYPATLPGGWHLLGRTTSTLFDPSADPPVLLSPGDGVRFEPLPEGVVP